MQAFIDLNDANRYECESMLEDIVSRNWSTSRRVPIVASIFAPYAEIQCWDPIWRANASDLLESINESWQRWQEHTRNQNFSDSERRRKLDACLRHIAEMESKEARDRIIDKIMGSEGVPSASGYEHTTTTTTTTTTSTIVSQQQREQVASQFLQHLTTSGSTMGLEQANIVREAILTGRKDDLVQQQLQGPQPGPSRQALLPQPPVPQAPAQPTFVQQPVVQQPPAQQQAMLPSAQNPYAYSPPPENFRPQGEPHSLLHSLTTTTNTTTSSAAVLQSWGQPTPQNIQQPIQSQGQLQYQQQLQIPQLTQQLQSQQPLQIAAGPSQSPGPSYVPRTQSYSTQPQITQSEPVQQAASLQGQHLATTLTQSPTQAMQPSQQVQQKLNTIPPPLLRGYTYPLMGQQQSQQLSGSTAPLPQTPQLQQQLAAQGSQQTNTSTYQQPNVDPQQQLAQYLQQLQIGSGQPQLPTGAQQALVPSIGQMIPGKKDKKHRKHSHKH